MSEPRRFAYADPPYIGQAKKHYTKEAEAAGRVAIVPDAGDAARRRVRGPVPRLRCRNKGMGEVALATGGGMTENYVAVGDEVYSTNGPYLMFKLCRATTRPLAMMIAAALNEVENQPLRNPTTYSSACMDSTCSLHNLPPSE